MNCPGGPVVKTPCSRGRCLGSIPGWGTKILHAAQPGQEKEGKKKSTSNLTTKREVLLTFYYKILLSFLYLHIHFVKEKFIHPTNIY